MTGYELWRWRRGGGWTQKPAAEEVGASLRTFKVYEQMRTAIPKMAEHSTRLLELRTLLPELSGLPVDLLLARLRMLCYECGSTPANRHIEIINE